MNPGESVPREPPMTPWRFPPASELGPEDLVAVGADLEPGTLVQAYRRGMFPMPLDSGGTLGWWSPDPRGLIEPEGFHTSRSLRRSMRRFDVTFDQEFARVLAACADPARPQGWISDDMARAYLGLHELGWAHSVEVWSNSDLVGGLYGVAIGAFFAGESMFHHEPDASKAAVATMADVLTNVEDALFDVQWTTPHLRSLGAVDIGRKDYLLRLTSALAAAGPPWPSPG
ncbi:MAG: leucyl/phenylalanyl-tRNA--protein transferase [Acidimicrobiales bacterium]